MKKSPKIILNVGYIAFIILFNFVVKIHINKKEFDVSFPSFILSIHKLMNLQREECFKKRDITAKLLFSVILIF